MNSTGHAVYQYYLCRVLKPPGGGCSNIFGVTPEQKPTKSGESNQCRSQSDTATTAGKSHCDIVRISTIYNYNPQIIVRNSVVRWYL